MEALLPRCLDSLINAKNAHFLDILVVNDGSKDRSSEIGHQYKEKHPDIIQVIDKPNGNYGSTINAGLLQAKGKFVKILDSDDWFDTMALNTMIEQIKNIDVDVVVTHFSQLGPGHRKEVVRYNTMGYEPYLYNHIYALDDILKDGYSRFFLMHALTYRTELLRSIHYTQTEGISYTDTEWATIPIFHAQTICFLNLNVYQYNLDRAGQTMAPEVLMKSIPQLIKVNDRLIQYYRDHMMSISTTRSTFIKRFLENRVRILYKLYLLDMPRDNFKQEDMYIFDNKMWSICQQLQLQPKLYPENKLLRIEYINYWHKYHKRWPIWIETINRVLDIIVKQLYVKLFRR